MYSDVSLSASLIGKNYSVLQCLAFRLNVSDHLSSQRNGDCKWVGNMAAHLQDVGRKEAYV